MAVVEVHPEPVEGPWVEGFVLDRHVISSRPIGYVGDLTQLKAAQYLVFASLLARRVDETKPAGSPAARPNRASAPKPNSPPEQRDRRERS